MLQFYSYKMDQADLLKLLTLDASEQTIRMNIPGGSVVGIIQGIRRESGDGRSFLIDLDTDTGKRSLFVPLD